VLSKCVRFLLSAAFTFSNVPYQSHSFYTAFPVFITFLKQKGLAEGLWCLEAIPHFSVLIEDLIFKMGVF